MPLLQKTILAALAGAGTYAAAGGWAVTTVINPPAYLEAGTTYQLDYAVRQHGITLLNGLRGSVDLEPGASAATSAASAAAGEGRYRATFRVPETDRLTLKVRSGFGAAAWSDLTLLTIPVVRQGGAAPALTGRERGRQLFVAKGCGTCHVNGDVPEFAARNHVVNAAPELTGRRLDPAYVRQRLTDPSSLPKVGDYGERMPDLGLTAAEVTALVALLTEPPVRATN